MAMRTSLFFLSLLLSLVHAARERRSQVKQLGGSLAEIARSQDSSAGPSSSSDADLVRLTADIRGMFTFNGSQAPPDAPPEEAGEAVALPQQTAKSVPKPVPLKAPVPAASTSLAAATAATARAVPTAKPVVEAPVPAAVTSLAAATAATARVVPTAKPVAEAPVPAASTSLAAATAATARIVPTAKPVAEEHVNASSFPSTTARATTQEHAQNATATANGKDNKLLSQALNHASTKSEDSWVMVEALPMAKLALGEDIAEEDMKANNSHNASAASSSASNASTAHLLTEASHAGNATEMHAHSSVNASTPAVAIGADHASPAGEHAAENHTASSASTPASSAENATGVPAHFSVNASVPASPPAHAAEIHAHSSVKKPSSPVAKVVVSSTTVVESTQVSNTSAARVTTPRQHVSEAAPVAAESKTKKPTANAAPAVEVSRLKHEHELEAEVARLKEKLAMQTSSSRQASPSHASSATTVSATAAPAAAVPASTARATQDHHHRQAALAHASSATTVSESNATALHSTTRAAALVAEAATPQSARQGLRRSGGFQQPQEGETFAMPKVSLRETLRRPEEDVPQPPRPEQHQLSAQPPSHHIPKTRARSVEDSVASLPLSGLVTLDSAVATGAEKESLPEYAAAETHLQSPLAVQPPPAATTLQPVPTQPPHLGWFWSFVNWLTGRSSSSTNAGPAAPAQGVKFPSSSAVDGPLALLSSSVPKQREAETRETMRQTHKDSQRVISISEPWDKMANEDAWQEAKIRGEDNTLRVEAMHTPPPRHDPAAATLHGGSRVSGFWGTLEKEDADIEDSLLDDKDLTRYQHLTQLQDEQVTNAVSQLAKESPSVLHHPLRGQDTSFGSAQIHETWADLEAKDVSQEKKVHADPQLRMLQEKSHHQLRHPSTGARP